eukprot:15445482-Alexandrium_andersonii.AAC.1
MWTYAGDATVLGGNKGNVVPMEIDAMRKGKEGQYRWKGRWRWRQEQRQQRRQRRTLRRRVLQLRQ